MERGLVSRRLKGGFMATRLVPVGLAGLLLVAQQGESDFGNIVWFIVVGAVIGLIARLIVPGTGGMGFLLTIVVGIVGAVIGGWLAGQVFQETGGVDWIASILVAAVLVWIVARSTSSRRAV
jgi:uncharacterized membrane protein YeaQ/YmgE (transglycosylase-associated protein family)